jgi:hypothetical protein
VVLLEDLIGCATEFPDLLENGSCLDFLLIVLVDLGDLDGAFFGVVVLADLVPVMHHGLLSNEAEVGGIEYGLT